MIKLMDLLEDFPVKKKKDDEESKDSAPKKVKTPIPEDPFHRNDVEEGGPGSGPQGEDNPFDKEPSDDDLAAIEKEFEGVNEAIGKGMKWEDLKVGTVIDWQPGVSYKVTKLSKNKLSSKKHNVLKSAQKHIFADKYDLKKQDFEDSVKKGFIRSLTNTNPRIKEGKLTEGFDLKKLEIVIKSIQQKIKKQGRVTNARDEEHLKQLIKVYKDMGGRKIKEAMSRRIAGKTLKIPQPGDFGNNMDKYFTALNKHMKEVEKLAKLQKKKGVKESVWALPKGATTTSVDELDAELSRAGIKSNPDFTRLLVKVDGNKGKINKIMKTHKATKVFEGKLRKEIREIVKEACQKGYMTHPTRKTKEMFGKRYRNCVKKENAVKNHDGKAAPYGSGYKKAKKKIKESQVAKTILQQLGGNKFIAMTGAKNLGASNKSLSMKIGRNSKSINYVVITLKSSDLYDVEFIRIRGAKRTVVKKLKGVYADQLQTMFTKYTGMRTSL